MSALVERVLSFPAPLAYALIGALVFGEAAVFVGFVLPGETAVLLGGVMAATGHLSLAVLLLLVVVAAVVGDTVGYEVGRHLGTRVLDSGPLRRHRGRLAGAEEFLRERGGWAVFLGRFTAFLRAVLPGLAGTTRMPYRRFLVFNAAGGLLWGTGVVLLGYFAGHSYAAAERTLGRMGALFAVAAVAAALVTWRRARKRRSAAAPEDRRLSPGSGGR